MATHTSMLASSLAACPSSRSRWESSDTSSWFSITTLALVLDCRARISTRPAPGGWLPPAAVPGKGQLGAQPTEVLSQPRGEVPCLIGPGIPQVYWFQIMYFRHLAPPTLSSSFGSLPQAGALEAPAEFQQVPLHVIQRSPPAQDGDGFHGSWEVGRGPPKLRPRAYARRGLGHGPGGSGRSVPATSYRQSPRPPRSGP